MVTLPEGVKLLIFTFQILVFNFGNPNPDFPESNVTEFNRISNEICLLFGFLLTMNLTRLFLLLFATITADEQLFSKDENWKGSLQRIFGNRKNIAILGNFGPVGTIDPTKSSVMG